MVTETAYRPRVDPLVFCQTLKMGLNRGREKGSDTKSRNGPWGASHFWCLTPFPGHPKSKV